MCASKICCWFLFVFAFALASASEQELLQMKDVNKIMKQIFDQHIDKKEMTTSILKNSFKVYVDQFDPNRVYLLEKEVLPFLQISGTGMARLLNQYQQNQFPEYQELNTIIQNAISRSRQIRLKLEREDSTQLFPSSVTYAIDGYEEWRDPDLKRPFAKTEDELEGRIRQEIVQFISGERKRYGDSFIENRKIQTLRIFEKDNREHENQYLFLNGYGQPMSEIEKQNAFALHILKALANSLDAHTSVLDPNEAYDMRVRLEKEIQGIGIMIQPTSEGGFIVSQIVEGGPASKSGQVKINDLLLEIDGKPLRNEPLSKVMEMIRGKRGSTVTLLLKHTGEDGEKTLIVKLVRDEITINEDRVKSSFETFGTGIIGKIKLDSFYQGENGVTSENDLREAIKKLDKEGNLRGLILDFRENSGGFLSQAVKVAGLFITNGVIVISKYFNGEEHVYRDVDSKRAFDGPLIILTSKATASAAEIVAQALQDYGVALIVGDEHTYGKGTIQSQTVTEHQAATYFKVTVGKYYTVSGKTPQIQGVRADIVVPSQFIHENIGEEYLDYPLKEDTIASKYNDNLEDIAPNLKPWYMHYYTPMLQHRRLLWRNMLPILKKNSEYRISHNKNYQMFLKGSIQEEIKPQNFGADDLQMTEAVNIMKDMISLYSQERGNEPEEELLKQANILQENK